MAIPDCMKSLDVSSQGTFREFFLHTQDMCYFLEHQLWQEKTSNAVNELVEEFFLIFLLVIVGSTVCIVINL